MRHTNHIYVFFNPVQVRGTSCNRSFKDFSTSDVTSGENWENDNDDEDD
jgi:hypothetical protein